MDNELLHAIGQMMDSKLETVKADMAQMMDSKLEPITGKLDEIDQRVRRTEITQENITNRNIGIIVESLTGVHEKLDRLAKVEDTQENHDHRIWALEQATKRALP